MDELQRQTGGGLLFSSHLMKAEDPAESFLPISLSLVVLSEKHSPHRGEVKEAVKEQEEGETSGCRCIRRCRGFSLLQVIFLSAGDGGPLQGHTISPLCLSFPSSLARFISSPLPRKPQFELVPAVLPLAGYFFFLCISQKLN